MSELEWTDKQIAKLERSNMNHTPAPWKIEKYSEGNVRDAERIKGASGLVIVNEVWGASLSECDANYKLIAAAPDLLEALRVLTDHAQEKYPHFESERGQKDIEASLKAIAKAEAA
jgi:hypothetical protein